MKHYDLVYIIWVDHYSRDAWARVDEKEGLPECHSVGYLLYEDDMIMKISHTVAYSDDADETCCSIVLHKGSIVSYRILPHPLDFPSKTEQKQQRAKGTRKKRK